MNAAPLSPESGLLRRYFIIMLAVYAAWIALYYFTAWVGELRGPAFDPSLPIDDTIPYIPSLLPIYYLAYIIIPGLFLISREPAFLNRAYITIIAANAFAFLFFIVFPAMGPERVTAADDAGFVQWMVGLTHGLDSRYNAVPSLHVTNPWLLFLLSARKRGWDGITALCMLLAITIGTSTIVVKQHYLLDLATGIVLALVAYWMVGRMRISERAWGRGIK